MPGEGLVLDIGLAVVGLIFLALILARVGDWVVNGMDEVIAKFGIAPRVAPDLGEETPCSCCEQDLHRPDHAPCRLCEKGGL